MSEHRSAQSMRRANSSSDHENLGGMLFVVGGFSKRGKRVRYASFHFRKDVKSWCGAELELNFAKGVRDFVKCCELVF